MTNSSTGRSSAAEECFCPALRHPVDAAGEVDTTRRDVQEPIAGDVRSKDGAVPGEARRSDVRGLREVLDFMRLKLIAGLMGVGFDELVQRDKARQATELRRRIAVLAGVALAIAALAVYALFERRRALDSEQRVAANASRSHYDLAQMLLARQDDAAALAHLAESLRNNPQNQVATSFALNLLLHREWPIPERNPLPPDTPVRGVVLSPDGGHILTWSGGKTLLVWNASTGKQATPPIETTGDILDAFFSRDSTRVLATSADGIAHIWDAATGRELQRFVVPERRPAKWLHDERRLLVVTAKESARIGKPPVASRSHPRLPIRICCFPTAARTGRAS